MVPPMVAVVGDATFSTSIEVSFLVLVKVTVTDSPGSSLIVAVVLDEVLLLVPTCIIQRKNV